MTVTRTFQFSGANYSWTVPANIDGTTVHVTLRGASGTSSGGTGASSGGYVEGDLAVAAGDVLTFWPGGRGANGGWNGGGVVGAGGASSLAGGGASDIRKNGSALTNRVCVAAGAGSSAGTKLGGVGGASTGGSGQAGTSESVAAAGGTQSAGGAAAVNTLGAATAPTAGTLGVGGNSRPFGTGVGPGGPGGGGYYGGGGGASGSGAGGSNYIGGLTGTITNTAGATAQPEADGVITVTYNLIPNKPTLLTPTPARNLDRNLAQTFTWQFSDDDPGDTQTAYELQYRTGTGAWTTTGKIASTSASKTFAVDTFLSLVGQSVEWQVRTWDTSDRVGPWSTSGFFTPQNPPATSVAFNPAPTLVSNMPTVGIHRTDNTAMTQYQIRVVTDDGAGNPTNTVVADTGVVASGATGTLTRQLPTFAYVNGSKYHVQAQISFPADVWQHAWTDSGALTANVAAPLAPTVILSPLAGVGVGVIVTNPGSDPAAPVNNEIYRVDPATGTEELIAVVPIASGGGMTDYEAWLNRPVTYRVVAVTATGARTSSA